MTNPDDLHVVPKLNGTNWWLWFSRMECHLVIYDLWEVTETEPDCGKENDGELNEEEKAVVENVKEARRRILDRVSPKYTKSISKCQTANQAWTLLKKIDRKTAQSRARKLKSQLSRTRLHRSEDIDDYIGRTMLLAAELGHAGLELPEKEVAAAILGGLPASYNSVVTILELCRGELSVDKIRVPLLTEQSTINMTKSYCN